MVDKPSKLGQTG